MFDLNINEHSDRDLLVRILKELHAMAVDLNKLHAAVTRNGAAVDALIAAHGTAGADTAAAQAAVDAAADAIDAASAKAEAAVAPPAA